MTKKILCVVFGCKRKTCYKEADSRSGQCYVEYHMDCPRCGKPL